MAKQQVFFRTSKKASQGGPITIGKPRAILISLLCIAGVGLLFLLILRLWNSQPYISLNYLLPVDLVQVDAPFYHVKEARIAELISPIVEKSNYWVVDLVEIKSTLEREPWIEYAIVGKSWPNILRIKIKEYKPVALWKNQYLVSSRGEVFSKPNDDIVSQIKNLPHLDGPKGTLEMVKDFYLVASELLRKQNLKVTYLRLTETKNWLLHLSNGVHLILVHEEALLKLWGFIQVYPYLKTLKLKIKQVDLRYPNGFAVKWGYTK